MSVTSVKSAGIKWLTATTKSQQQQQNPNSSDKISTAAVTTLRYALAEPVACRALLLSLSVISPVLAFLRWMHVNPVPSPLEKKKKSVLSIKLRSLSQPHTYCCPELLYELFQRISVGSFLFKFWLVSSVDVAPMCYCPRQEDFERPQVTSQSPTPAIPPGQESSTDNPCWA